MWDTLIQLSQAENLRLEPEEAYDLLSFSEEHFVPSTSQMQLWSSQLHLREELPGEESLKLQCEETILKPFKHPSPVL